LPKRNGATVQWYRYGVLGAKTTPRTTAGGPGIATEGMISAGSTMSSAVVTATVAQYTDFIALSDFARDIHIDDNLAQAAKELGYSAGLSVDTITRSEIDTATGTAVMTLLNGSTFTAKDAANGFFTLQALDVQPMDSGRARGMFYGIIHPYVAYDFMLDPAVGGMMDLQKYTKGIEAFSSYEDRGWVGTVHNCKFYMSNNVKITAGSPNTYRTYIFGKDGVGSVDLAGKGPSQTNDVKVKPFKINTYEGKINEANPEGTIGGIASYNFSFVVRLLQTAPYRLRYWECPSTIG
jgi:N4-gp56 family major capsid protein